MAPPLRQQVRLPTLVYLNLYHFAWVLPRMVKNKTTTDATNQCNDFVKYHTVITSDKDTIHGPITVLVAF